LVRIAQRTLEIFESQISGAKEELINDEEEDIPF